MDKNRGEINDFGVPRTWKIAKWVLLERPQHPQTPKLCGKRSISITFLTMKKNVFSRKSFFRNIFGIFDSSKQGFSRFWRSGDVSVPTHGWDSGSGSVYSRICSWQVKINSKKFQPNSVPPAPDFGQKWIVRHRSFIQVPKF